MRKPVKRKTPVTTNSKPNKPVTKPSASLTMEQKYGVAGSYGPKSEEDTKKINWIENVGRAPIPAVYRPTTNSKTKKYKKGGATKSTYKKGGVVKATAKKTIVKSKKK